MPPVTIDNPILNSPYREPTRHFRFDANDRVAELRALYQSGPESKGVSWTRQLLNVHEKSCGAPEELPASWTAAWPDLPRR